MTVLTCSRGLPRVSVDGRERHPTAGRTASEADAVNVAKIESLPRTEDSLPAPIGSASSQPRHSLHVEGPGGIRVHRGVLRVFPTRLFDVLDMTADVQKCIDASGIHEGSALVYCQHTTCGLVLNEKESGLLADLNALLSRLVPDCDYYLHDDFAVRTENLQPNELRNAHAHLRCLLAANASQCIPVHQGSLMLGQWQRVMLVEFDSARPRTIVVQIMGQVGSPRIRRAEQDRDPSDTGRVLPRRDP